MSTLHAPRHEYGNYAELLDDYYERGWTDGLPVVPPTPELVADFLAAAELDPDVVIGAVPTRQVIVTAEHVAINAVMAGCRPSTCRSWSRRRARTSTRRATATAPPARCRAPRKW